MSATVCLCAIGYMCVCECVFACVCNTCECFRPYHAPPSSVHCTVYTEDESFALQAILLHENDFSWTTTVLACGWTIATLVLCTTLLLLFVTFVFVFGTCVLNTVLVFLGYPSKSKFEHRKKKKRKSEKNHFDTMFHFAKIWMFQEFCQNLVIVCVEDKKKNYFRINKMQTDLRVTFVNVKCTTAMKPFIKLWHRLKSWNVVGRRAASDLYRLVFGRHYIFHLFFVWAHAVVCAFIYVSFVFMYAHYS